MQAGVLLSIDLEIFYVEAVTGQGTITATVASGFSGSASTSHTDGTLIYINPKFSDFDILNALNEDLDDLSSPDNGLFAIATADITYNPVLVGYDLAGISSTFIDIIEVRYKTPLPYQYFPPIRKWRVQRNMSDSAFPSGTALYVYEPGFPGLVMHVTAKVPFTALAALTDDLVTKAGLSLQARELPWMGACVSLVAGREVKRNFTESQADPRKAAEVPPGAVMASYGGLMKLRERRISAEAKRLETQYQPARDI